jgi:hypothetical protein
LFVAHPELAPPSSDYLYARPDDRSPDERTWRERLRRYNETEIISNPLRLLPAYQLYANQVYRQLVDTFGLDRVFILSAGWGLIPASYLTPLYDITFSQSADPWQRRSKRDGFPTDSQMLPADDEETIFLGGKDYLPQFCELMPRSHGPVTVYFSSKVPPECNRKFTLRCYSTVGWTNWHYACAKDLIAQRLQRDSAPARRLGPRS